MSNLTRQHGIFHLSIPLLSVTLLLDCFHTPFGKLIQSDMWRFIRKILTLPVLITLTCAIVIYVLVPVFLMARAEALANMVENNLFQHSGWHASDCVHIDSDFNVIAVSSCPECSDPKYKMHFVVVEDDKTFKYLEDSSSVPESTVKEAERWLFNYKQAPRYRRIRATFGRQRSSP